MMELWAVIGQVLLNKSFHAEIFGVARFETSFEDLKDLRKALRITHHQNLGRWEIMVINEHLTQSNFNINQPPMQIFDPDGDLAVQPIRNGWPGSAPPPTFPGDFDLCAVVGLCSMDFEYRKDLYSVTDPNTGHPNTQPLEHFLTDLTAEDPIFSLNALQLINLNNFMRYTDPSGLTMIDLLYNYHIQKWIQPLVYPCNGGYTETTGTNYIYFAQSALVRVTELEPDGKSMLRKHGVLFPV